MKPYFKTSYELAQYHGYDPESDLDFTRLEYAWRLYQDDYMGDGCMGAVAEVLSCTKGSKKAYVSKAGRTDTYIMFRYPSGAIVPTAAERKTNGGRIRSEESAYRPAEEINNRYVIYSLDVCNSGTGHKRRYVPAVVIPRELFMVKLAEFGALKEMRHNGRVDGIGIQATSKLWFEWLVNWPIVYDRNAVYSADDFEGLE